MLDEMLDAFESLQKSCSTMLDEVCSQSGFSSNIFWFIQPDFHDECIWVQFHPTFGLSSLRWVQIICSGVCFKRFYWVCGVPQKITRRKDCKQDQREEARLVSKREKDSNARKDWTDDKISLPIDILKTSALAYGTCILIIHWLYQLWHKRDSIHRDHDIIGLKYSLNKN